MGSWPCVSEKPNAAKEMHGKFPGKIGNSRSLFDPLANRENVLYIILFSATQTAQFLCYNFLFDLSETSYNVRQLLLKNTWYRIDPHNFARIRTADEAGTIFGDGKMFLDTFIRLTGMSIRLSCWTHGCYFHNP